MTLRRILWCLLFHDRVTYGRPVRSMKCHKCGLYFRIGPATARWQGWGNHKHTPLRPGR